MNMKKRMLLAVLGLSLVSAALCAQNLPKVNVFLVGDSTVCGFNDTTYYYPRFGYGTKLACYLDSSATVVNLAVSGRSSKDFLTDPNYETLRTSIKAGDFLLIGFGHNDEKAEAARYTNPLTGITDPASFKYSLYANYIKLALDAGATPILCTPIVRRSTTGDYSGGSSLHQTTSVPNYDGGDYAECIRQLGKEKGIVVIDNTALTRSLYESVGPEVTIKFHAWISSKPASVDNTHTNEYGAATNAYVIAKALKTSGSSLAQYVLPVIKAPDASMLTANTTYVERVYAPSTEKSAIWTTTAPWQGTVFGDIGGQNKASADFYKIAEEGKTVVMRSGPVGASSGKIASGSDGIAMYFQAIPADKDFTLSATATVTDITSNNQVSFGLMVRDDIYIDLYDSSICSQYVAAAPLYITKAQGEWSASFARLFNPEMAKNMLVPNPSVKSAVPVKGSVVKLSIEKKGSTYIVTYGKEKPVVYTADLAAVDPAYVYAGLFTCRQCEVVFSNISLKIK